MDFFFDLLVFMPMYVSLFWMVVLLLTRGEGNKAKQFLGIFMFVTSLLYFSHSVYFSSEYQLYVYCDSFYVLAMLSVYPLYYEYIKMLTSDYRFNPKIFINLIPAVVMSLSVATVYLLMENGVEFVHKYHYAEGDITSNNSLYMLQKYLLVSTKVIFFVQIILFLTKGLQLIRKYEKRLLEFYSDTEKRDVSWVRLLILVFTLTGIASTFANIIGRAYFNAHDALLLFPVLVFSLLIFILGFWGFTQSHSVYDLEVDKKENDEYFEIVSGMESIKGDVSNPLLKKQLINLFEHENIYRKQDLKITHVSEMLNTNRTYVSRLINSEFGCSFSFYVNRYRVEETKKILSEKSDSEPGLESIAEQVGFPSVGSLIRNFKLVCGVTPGTFRKMNQ
ncbi:MAG: helix-turn-helix domain-containing protein [Prolixibacteraceae bacterium]|jgi:AraC-like DNA-binding protein|nr:helix-turn-helix domain-containing protein [Prolixibacteraceae bacterium]